MASTNHFSGIKSVALFLFVSLFFTVDAQVSFGINPTMKVSNLAKSSESPMKLEELKIDVKVIGQIATTTLEMTYRNANSRTMEGEFNFPLGEGQSVSRFALDINGEMREGVIVEKEKGRKTFEAVIRRNVDPGLLEMTAGNNFRARVYPLPANGVRKITIAFEQELSNKGSHDLYLLPLNIQEQIAKFSFHVEVFKKPVEFDCDNNQFDDILLTKWHEAYISDASYENFKPNKQIGLRFPHVENSKSVYTASKNNDSDSSYFYINIKPKLLTQKKVLPNNISIFWDNSNSSSSRNFEKEYLLLNNYLSKIGNVKVELIPFNIKQEKAKVFDIINGNSTGLITFLKNMTYDGATSLSSVNFSSATGEEILLFTDGISNFNEGDLQNSNTPIITVNSNLIANHATLNFLAQNSGGTFVNLNKLSDEEALNLLLNNDYHFISAQIKQGNISEMYPKLPTQFQNNFSLAGILTGKTAALTLNFGYGKTIVYSEEITIDVDTSTNTELLSRLWALKKINELSFDEEKNKAEILKTAKEHTIVTKNTSLIVLDRLEDYIEHRITPPKSMLTEYEKRIAKIDREKEESEKVKLKKQIEKVIELSEEQTKWWKTTYSLLPPKKETAEKKVIQADDATRDVMNTSDSPSEERIMRFISPNVEDSVQLDGQTGEELQKNKRNGGNNTKSDIQLNAWDPQTPYFKVLQYAKKGEEYQTYLKLKLEYGSTPSFYIDASDFFAKLNAKDTAVKILSNLAELNLESPQLLRVLGTKLLDLKRTQEAVTVFQKVLKMKGEEAQSYRDLGHAYEANKEFQKAIDIMYEAVKIQWDARFPGIELIIMNEINDIINQNSGLNLSHLERKLVKNEPTDLRVILTWDTDNCDMDLWVTDPYGEKCFYSHQLTTVGGKMTKDFTGGYGPEEFMTKNAVKGTYVVQANYYGTRSQAVLAPVNLHLEFITNFGKASEKRQQVTIRLENKEDVIDVGKFVFSGN